MALEFYTEKEIARPRATRARSALAGEPDALTLANALWDFHGVGLEFFRGPATEGNLARRAMESLFQGDHDVGLHILTALGNPPKSSPAAAEHLLEEITEARSTK